MSYLILNIKKYFLNGKRFLRYNMFTDNKIAIFYNPLFLFRSSLFKEIRKVSNQFEGDILDLGCGSKPYLNLFKRCNKYIGLDVNESGHNHKYSSIDFFYDGNLIPFEDNKFDNAVSFEVLQAVPDIEKTISELSRVTKNNGLILFTMPFAWEECEVPYDFLRLTEFGIQKLVNKTNLKLVQFNKIGNHFSASMQTLISYFIYQLPKQNKFLKYFFILTLTPVLNIFSLIANSILPKYFDYYHGSLFIIKNCKD